MRKTVILTAALLGTGLAATWQGRAYLSNRSGACGDCHEMVPRMEGWKRGPHGKVAQCADCHVPPGAGGIPVKVTDGLRHALLHGTGGGGTPVLRSGAQRTLQENCLACHGDLVPMETWRVLRSVPQKGRGNKSPRPDTAHHADGRMSCVACHRGTGHRAV